MSLELSASTIVLNHPQLASPTSGMQGSVCLYNRFSVPATFKWEMEEEVEQTLFITHPEGVVPPKSFLHCEFAVQGTYHCTSQLPLVLLVNGANEQKVDCLVQYGKPQCVVEQNNVLFGSVPLNLTTSRRVVIKNTGKCHAYFNVSHSYVQCTCSLVLMHVHCCSLRPACLVTSCLGPLSSLSVL